MERAGGDEEDVLRVDGAVFRYDGAALHQGKQIALDAFAGAWEQGLFSEVTGGAWFISTGELLESMGDARGLTSRKLAGQLKRLGLEHCQKRVRRGARDLQRKGFLVTGSNGKLKKIEVVGKDYRYKLEP